MTVGYTTKLDRPGVSDCHNSGLDVGKGAMARVTTILSIVMATALCASADRLVLSNGQSFTGTVTTNNQVVEIQAGAQKLQFAAGEVLRIQYAEELETKLAQILQNTPPDEPEGLFAAANWANENGLSDKAEELFQRTLQFDPSHAGAHRGLGEVRIDGVWRPFHEAMELARSKLEAGLHKALLQEILPELETASPEGEKHLDLQELKGQTQLRAGLFEAARETFETLSESAEEPQSLRYAAIADILTENPDGMYVLAEPQPPLASLLDQAADCYPAGPASLADPVVLQAALRDRAKEDIEAGRRQMAEAATLEPTDPGAANGKYDLALEAFDRAEALVEDLCRSYRVEIARRKVTVLRKDIQDDSADFDREMNKLGRQDITPKAYQEQLERMIESLDNVRRALRRILEITSPYPRELMLEIEWAQLDLQRVREMHETLTAELDGKN